MATIKTKILAAQSVWEKIIHMQTLQKKLKLQLILELKCKTVTVHFTQTHTMLINIYWECFFFLQLIWCWTSQKLVKKVRARQKGRQEVTCVMLCPDLQSLLPRGLSSDTWYSTIMPQHLEDLWEYSHNSLICNYTQSSMHGRHNMHSKAH